MKAFFKKENVHTIFTQNETKANYAERVIRTMKTLCTDTFLKTEPIDIQISYRI